MLEWKWWTEGGGGAEGKREKARVKSVVGERWDGEKGRDREKAGRTQKKVHSNFFN